MARIVVVILRVVRMGLDFLVVDGVLRRRLVTVLARLCSVCVRGFEAVLVPKLLLSVERVGPCYCYLLRYLSK